MSCNVTESIVFNEQMGGTYITNIDLSTMMAMANESRPEEVEREVSMPIDTTIVFNEFFETFKDSIATLPSEKQDELQAMKGLLIDMHMDEANGVFNFTMNKEFSDFNELKQINEQLDGAMSLAESFGKKDETESPPQDQLEELTKSDPVVYTFDNNTFNRFQPKKEEVTETIEGEEPSETEDMADMFKVQFEDVFESTFYTMTYTFPKSIKSVSNKNAVLSEDRKTMTLKTNLNSINKDATLMDLEVILED
jgi:hypothetical protein